MINVRLSNGVVLQGTMQQITELAARLGEEINLDGYYLSSTHGWMRVAGMDTRHIKNAIGKKLREHKEGKPTDATFYNLVNELITRA